MKLFEIIWKGLIALSITKWFFWCKSCPHAEEFFLIFKPKTYAHNVFVSDKNTLERSMSNVATAKISRKTYFQQSRGMLHVFIK